jgi:hypothetical protein
MSGNHQWRFWTDEHIKYAALRLALWKEHQGWGLGAWFLLANLIHYKGMNTTFR